MHSREEVLPNTSFRSAKEGGRQTHLDVRDSGRRLAVDTTILGNVVKINLKRTRVYRWMSSAQSRRVNEQAHTHAPNGDEVWTLFLVR